LWLRHHAGDTRRKRDCTAGLYAAALGLVANQLI